MYKDHEKIFSQVAMQRVATVSGVVTVGLSFDEQAKGPRSENR